MQTPELHGAIPIAHDITSIASTMPVPGFGALAVNAFLLRGEQPLLVDTGLPALREEWVQALCTVIDPTELRWIWITHADPDHTGALERILELAPHARVVTNYLGMGKLGMRGTIAPERFYLINPEQTLDLGDRELEALAMPAYDAPETMGLFDRKTRTLFSADCFGALLDEDDALRAVESVEVLDPAALERGMTAWAGVDAPWLSSIPELRLAAGLNRLRRLRAELVLSAHLPPAPDLGVLLENLSMARHAPPFVGPDQAALEAMMAAA